MHASNAFIMNQMRFSRPNLEIFPDEYVYVPLPEPPPSRFRRKKGYAGRTAQPYNRNYESMPDGF